MQNGILTDSGYLLQAKSPLDVRQKFDSVEEMKNYNENFLYDGIETIIILEGEIEGKKYNWFSKREVDETLGKWREVTATVDFVTEDEMNALLIEIFGDLNDENTLLDSDGYILVDSNGYSILTGNQIQEEMVSYTVTDANGNTTLDKNNYTLLTS